MLNCKVSRVIAGAIVVLAGFGTSGCSNAPSENDARKVVEDSLGNCRYLAIGRFERINGIPGDEGDYRVEVKYSINMTPTPNNLKTTEINVADLAKFDQDFLQAEADIKNYEDGRAAYLQANGGVGSSQYAIENEEMYIKYQRAGQVRSAHQQMRINGILAGMFNPLVSDFNNECPNVDKSIKDAFFKGDISLDKYAQNIEMEFEGTIPMIKTDNGWQVRR